MELATIARPYAEALFRVAEKGDLSQWSLRVSRLAEIGTNEQIRRLAADPRVKSSQVVDIVLSLLADDTSQELRNFLSVLVENDRVTLLPEVGVLFNELKNAREGVADAQITSAFPMSDDQVAELLGSLGKRFSRKLRAIVTVDNSLIGGVIVAVGDKVLDMSVRAKLQRMRDALVS
ncbi:MAG: F0F1 ATP synthase subunit delta [Burkholderiaceae bacterium]|jgi:F-type H+-transporting ATPase subunit delta|nr:F0F1 ATP synthase subunit delta [Burkholderiaceae bacterium]